MTVWIVSWIDLEENIHHEVFYVWEFAEDFYSKMEELYGDNNTTLKRYREETPYED